MKIIDISKCNEEVINYINELQNKYNELEKLNNELDESIIITCEENDNLIRENKRLNNIINELEKDLDRQIEFCTNEADGTTNDKYCRIAINYLKHLKDKLQELKGSNKV